MPFNFHTHCCYCDGKGNPKDFIIEAINQRFTAFGFSSHAPVPFENSFAMKDEDLSVYVAEIRQLQRDYIGQLPVFAGLECDYISDISYHFQDFRQKYNLDYIIGGVHLVNYGGQLWFIDGHDVSSYDEGLNRIFQSDIKKAVRQYFHQLCEMIENEDFDVIAHLDKIKMHNKNRYFTQDEKWYINHIEETIRLIKEKSLIVEINTRGLYKKRCDSFYPSPWVIKKLKEHAVPVTISTDAHNKDEISLYFPEAMRCLTECGVKEIAMLTSSGWELCDMQ